jgi:hypothetical protein
VVSGLGCGVGGACEEPVDDASEESLEYSLMLLGHTQSATLIKSPCHIDNPPMFLTAHFPLLSCHSPESPFMLLVCSKNEFLQHMFSSISSVSSCDI